MGTRNGTIRERVEPTNNTGTSNDVKVDATTSTVVTAEADGPEGPGIPGAPEAGGTQA